MSEVHGAAQVRGAKVLLIVSSFACLIFLGLAAYEDNFGGEWRAHQRAYREKLAPELKGAFRVGFKQNYLPDLNKVDRCISCHVAAEDPGMAGAPQPLAAHSGSYLKDHPPEKFGCTVCHDGQGRAIKKEDAHGQDPHWEQPLLAGREVFTVCSRCHAENDLYGAEAEFYGRPPEEMEIFDAELNHVLRGAERVERGKRLVAKSGCLGCHTYQGKGGALGPDITYVGDKDKHAYDYANIPEGEEHTPRVWLLRHFMNPGEVSPGTVMPDMRLEREDAEALTDYMLSLKRRTLPAKFLPPPPQSSGAPVHGKELFGMYCAACHGLEGRGSSVPEILTPKLNNVDTLAVAGDDYYRYIVAHGRSSTHMPRWDGDGGNLTPSQIVRIIRYMRSWEPPAPDEEELVRSRGDARYGRGIYAGSCANCHGVKGEGGIGPSLRSKNFLAMASERFLRQTIVHGRPGTAMPSWKRLGAQDVADVAAYLRAWQRPKAAYVFEDVEPLLPKAGAKPNRRSVTIGQKLFRANCSGCHGNNGDDALIGTVLNNQDFLAVASPRFLYESIVAGRPGTAMPAWRHLEKEDVADLINFVKSWQKVPDAGKPERKIGGDPEYGRLLFKRGCSGCHGESGEGTLGTQLANFEFLSAASDDYLYQTIARGRTGTAMRGFLRGSGSGETRHPGAPGGIVELLPEQIEHIVAFLRSQEEDALLNPRKRLQALMGAPHLGQVVYEKSGGCNKCHGDQGEGATGPALSNARFLEAASDGYLAGTVILGREGTEMLSFHRGGNVSLSQQQVLDVVAYIRRWERVPPPPDLARHLPVLAAEVQAGAAHYQSYCASCHGPEGKGGSAGKESKGFAPALNNPEFLQAASDGFLQATIARGRKDTPMRPFGKGAGGIAELDARTINQIVVFLRSWQSGVKIDQAPPAESAAAKEPAAAEEPKP